MAATVAYEAVGTADPTSQAPTRREWVIYGMVTALARCGSRMALA